MFSIAYVLETWWFRGGFVVVFRGSWTLGLPLGLSLSKESTTEISKKGAKTLFA